MDITFEGLGSCELSGLGAFKTKIEIDGNVFDILIQVISDSILRHELLIGTDFLQNVELSMRKNEIFIRPVTEKYENSVAEVFPVNSDLFDSVNAIDLSTVKNSDYRDKIKKLVDDYNPRKQRNSEIKMKILLTDEDPVYQSARRMSHSEKQIVSNIIEEWIEQDVAKPSLSDYASPVVLVKKKDNSYRLCVDYRQLNKKIIKDRYPLPLIEDQLDRLQDAQIFNVLDLKKVFFMFRSRNNLRSIQLSLYLTVITSLKKFLLGYVILQQFFKNLLIQPLKI